MASGLETVVGVGALGVGIVVAESEIAIYPTFLLAGLVGWGIRLLLTPSRRPRTVLASLILGLLLANFSSMGVVGLLPPLVQEAAPAPLIAVLFGGTGIAVWDMANKAITYLFNKGKT